MKCAIWGVEVESFEPVGDAIQFISSRAGGTYRISGSARQEILNANIAESKKVALSEFIFLSNRNFSVPIIDTQIVSAVNRPTVLSPLKQIDRFICALSDIAPRMGDEVNFRQVVINDDGAYLAAATNCRGATHESYHQQLQFLLEASVEIGYVWKNEFFSRAKLTLEGWSRIHDLGVSLNLSNQIFVAMWFGGREQRNVYEHAIKPAIESAGYVAVRIDAMEHNEKIDDQILSEIRKSKAVIVDLTCGLATPLGNWTSVDQVGAPRGGVFFEAGFAKGLGLPVVWTVKDAIANIENVLHFDIRQYNQIRWGENLEDFRDRLRYRIEATIGRGTLTSEK